MLSRGQGGESITAAALDEGARTMGVWLPLALSDIAALMFATIRMWAAKPDEVKVPKRSELLKGWALPFTASALKAEEEEAEALALFNSVKNLQAKQEAKDNADQVHK